MTNTLGDARNIRFSFRIRNRAAKPMHPALVGLLSVGVFLGLLGLAAVILYPLYS